MFKRSVTASEKPHCIPITKTSRLMLFIEIKAVHCNHHTKRINACVEVIVTRNKPLHKISAQLKLTYLLKWIK
jgi:hypothetical protein